MEGFIHNLNTMHSRGGNQVVFSSINYGTDTSAEGRMVIEELLNATIEGLGTRGEVPVFPIQISRLKTASPIPRPITDGPWKISKQPWTEKSRSKLRTSTCS